MSKTLSKIVAAGLIFVAPLLVILRRYQADQVTTTTESALGFVPLMFIVVVALVALSFFVNQFMEMVRQSKFGYLAIGVFGVIMATILFLSWTVIQWVVMNAQNDLNNFVATFNYHQSTLIEMLVFVAAGIAIVVIAKLLEFKKP